MWIIFIGSDAIAHYSLLVIAAIYSYFIFQSHLFCMCVCVLSTISFVYFS